MNRFWRTATICIVLSATVFAAAAELTPETAAKLPALSEFHDVIVPIWHQAWPAKDAALLRQMVPDVEKGVAKIAKAELPGILRDKADAWKQSLAKFEAAATEYKAAANGKDDARLLNAAENLHKLYEGLVKVIQPPLKEIDQFHSVLYVLYHYEYPEHKMDKVKVSVAALKGHMATLNKVQLPERLSNKQAAFDASRTKLSDSLDSLIATLATGDAKKLDQAIETMHSNYQDLEKVFD
jgi:hypothetical protein